MTEHNRMPDINRAERAEEELADVGKDKHEKCTQVGKTHAPWRTCPECDRLYQEDRDRTESEVDRLERQRSNASQILLERDRELLRGFVKEYWFAELDDDDIKEIDEYLRRRGEDRDAAG